MSARAALAGLLPSLRGLQGRAWLHCLASLRRLRVRTQLNFGGRDFATLPKGILNVLGPDSDGWIRIQVRVLPPAWRALHARVLYSPQHVGGHACPAPPSDLAWCCPLAPSQVDLSVLVVSSNITIDATWTKLVFRDASGAAASPNCAACGDRAGVHASALGRCPLRSRCGPTAAAAAAAASQAWASRSSSAT